MGKVEKKSTKKVEKTAKPAIKRDGSRIEAMKEFAEKMMAPGKKTRGEVAEALADKFGVAMSSATSYVYRWFVGKDYKKPSKADKAAPAKKSPVKAKAPAKKAPKKVEAKKAPAKKAVPAKKPVAKKVEKKKAVPAMASDIDEF